MVSASWEAAAGVPGPEAGAWDNLLTEGMEGFDGGDWDAAEACLRMLPSQGWFLQEPDVSAAPQRNHSGNGMAAHAGAAQAEGQRKRRRRTRPAKSLEEVESRRMIHIAVERSRRKQTSEYLAELRSLMPPSYAHRGDHASIVGGAINFVKELEQRLQSLQCAAKGDGEAPRFAGFFTVPRYTTRATSGSKPSSAVADVEVTMVESHANLRMLSRRRPRQLLRLLGALHGHRLTVVHLNMTSAGHMVLYSLSLKVEDDCQLSSADEIATAAHQVVEKIQLEQESLA